MDLPAPADVYAALEHQPVGLDELALVLGCTPAETRAALSTIHPDYVRINGATRRYSLAAFGRVAHQQNRRTS